VLTEFTPEQARRWEEWQQAAAASARRSDRVCRALGTVLLGAAILTLVVLLYQ
jgi:hypothetical protein